MSTLVIELPKHLAHTFMASDGAEAGDKDTILHILSCRTGKAHPQAAAPAIEIPNAIGRQTGMTIGLHVCGGLLGFVCRNWNRRSSSTIWVWDWRTGIGLQVSAIGFVMELRTSLS